MGKFVMKETKNGGVKFDLKAGNGEVIATSEAYSGDAACKKGIERSSPPPRATRPRPAASMALRASARMPLTPPL